MRYLERGNSRVSLPWLLRYPGLYSEIETMFLPRVLLIFSISCYQPGYFCVSHKCLSIINSNKQMADRIATELQLFFPIKFEKVPKTLFMCMEIFTKEVNS